MLPGRAFRMPGVTMRPADAARLLLLGVIWGSSFLFIKLALESLSPIQIVTGRLVLAAAVLGVLVAARRIGLPGGTGTWKALGVMAVVANIVPFLLITWGQERITSSLTAILNSTTPLFTAVIASLVLPGERFTPLRFAGIVLGFVGVGVIVGIDAAGSSITGELAIVLASLSYGIGFVYARRRLTGRADSPLRLSAGQFLVSSALVLPLLALDLTANTPTFGAVATLSVLALGIMGTGFAYLLYYRLIEDVGATTASFVTYLIPIVGVVLGRVFLGERLGWNALAGAVMVVGGIALAERGTRDVVPTEFEPIETAGRGDRNVSSRKSWK